MIRIALLLILFFPMLGWADCPPQDVDRSAVDRINRRYDDFFRYQREREEKANRANLGAEEAKAQREAHLQRMEAARKAYTRQPKDEAREEALRLQWEEMQKKRVAQMEAARKCEVEKRAAAEQLLQRGRKIPELKEFDLEDY